MTQLLAVGPCRAATLQQCLQKRFPGADWCPALVALLTTTSGNLLSLRPQYWWFVRKRSVLQLTGWRNLTLQIFCLVMT